MRCPRSGLTYARAHLSILFLRDAMTDQTQKPPVAPKIPSVERIPSEIWEHVFQSISDRPTWRALALTNHAWRKVFIEKTSLIALGMFSKQIPSTILPEAVAAWSSSKNTSWDKQRVRTFLKDYHENRKAQLDQDWTLSKVVQVLNLYRHCRFFARKFIASVFSPEDDLTSEFSGNNNPASEFSGDDDPASGLSGDDDPASKFSEDHRPTNPVTTYISNPENPSYPPSHAEMNRIERSFLRFELYCNLFAMQSPSQESAERFSQEEQRDIYFKHYVSWENEQLACVHDYLFRRLSIPFNYLALHDVKWGRYNVDVSFDHAAPQNYRKEYLLSIGLAFLQKLVDAQTYKQREKLLDPEMPTDSQFLDAGLHAQHQYDMKQSAEHNTGLDIGSMNKPFFSENNTGPEKAWEWAYKGNTSFRRYYDPTCYKLRAWGFCWWITTVFRTVACSMMYLRKATSQR